MIFDSPTPLYAVKSVLDHSIAGFNKEKLMLFCLAMSYKFKNPGDRAHVAVVGPSSEGKSHLVNETLRLFDIIHVKDFLAARTGTQRSRNGRKSFYKRNDEGKDAGESLPQRLEKLYEKHDGIILTGVSREVLKRWAYPYNNKIVVLAELDAATMAMGYIRQLMSEGEALSLTTEKIGAGYNIAVPWAVAGKAVWVATTASESVEHQFSNRVSLIYLSPTSSDRRAALDMIGKRMAAAWDGKSSMEINLEKIRKEIKKFPFWDNVTIPYVSHISSTWPVDVPSQKRIYADFLRLLKSVALVHKRKEACADDYELARMIFCAQKHKLSHSMLCALENIRAAEEKDAYLVKIRDELEPRHALTLEQICEEAGIAESTARDYMREFQKHGIIRQYYLYQKDDYGTTRRIPSVYSLTEYGGSGFSLPSFKTLMGEDYYPAAFKTPYNPFSGKPLQIPEKNENKKEEKPDKKEKKKRKEN